jgi:hypothetical protein
MADAELVGLHALTHHQVSKAQHFMAIFTEEGIHLCHAELRTA